MKPISNDKRELIIEARERGESAKAMALWLDISRASVYNIINHYKATSSLEPKPYPGKQSSLTARDFDRIRAAVKKEPDITLEELIEKLNLPIKKSRLSKILIDMGFSFKKKLSIRKSSGVKMLKKNAKNGKKFKKTYHWKI